MSTAFKSIVHALVAALADSPALAGGRVWPNRLRPLPATAATAVVVRLAGSGGAEAVLGALDWATRLAIECYARGAAGADPADAADALLSEVWKRLAAIDAAALGAMAITVNPAIDWQFDEGETPMACATVHLVVEHRTSVAELAAWP